MVSESVFTDLLSEINRQDELWGDQSHHPDGTAMRWDAMRAAAARQFAERMVREGKLTWRYILEEEVAEALAATGEKLREELIQVAAVALQWAAAIERRNG